MMNRRFLLSLMSVWTACGGCDDTPMMGSDVRVQNKHHDDASGAGARGEVGAADLNWGGRDGGDGLAKECHHHAASEASCADAGCNLYTTTHRFCVVNGECVREEGHSLCADVAMGADDISVPMFKEVGEGEYDVVVFAADFRETDGWTACRETPWDGAIRENAPKGCSCAEADPTTVQTGTCE